MIGSSDDFGFNAILHHDFGAGRRVHYAFPDGDVVGEPVFVPRTEDAEEGDGYLLALVYRGRENRSDPRLPRCGQCCRRSRGVRRTAPQGPVRLPRQLEVQRVGGTRQSNSSPPLMSTTSPVTNPASGWVRNVTTWANSSASQKRPTGI